MPSPSPSPTTPSASVVPKPWTFTQIGGDRLPIVLSGYSAPFGRPRKGAIVSDGYGLRQSETYYPGFGPPTRSIFGDIHDHWTLRGRWMDSVLGAGGARQLVYTVKNFINDGLPARITWADLSFTGLLLHIKPDRESEAQIPWTLTLAIDSDDSLAPAAVPVPKPNVPDQMSAVLSAQSQFVAPSLSAPGDIVFPGGFLDAIDTLVSQVAVYTGSLVNVADSIEDFEQASSAELNRFRGVLGQVVTAYATLSETLDSAQCDFGVGNASANSQSIWAQQRETDQAAIAEMLALLSALDLQAEIGLRSQVQQTARAQDGDTWESLSNRYYGSISQADTLRQANMARYGTKPAPGRPISIPKV